MIFLLLCHQVHHIAYFLDYSPNLYYCTLPGSSIFLINLFTKKSVFKKANAETKIIHILVIKRITTGLC